MPTKPDESNMKIIKVEKNSRLKDIIKNNKICESNVIVLRMFRLGEIKINQIPIINWKYLIKENCVLEFAKHQSVKIEVV